MATGNFYAGGLLDRAGDRRKQPGLAGAVLAAADTVLVPIRRGETLVSTGPDGTELARPRLSEHPAIARALREAALPWALLGFEHGRAVLAVDLGEAPDAETDAAADAAGTAGPADPADPGVAAARALVTAGGAFEAPRRLATRIDGPSAAVMAHALALLNWRRSARFCGRCGAPTAPEEAGHVAACPGCGTHHFPRTDPAVIMLVRLGERVLLARNARHPGRFFSTLAGFVEPGESLEEAVAREVREEVGASLGRIRYHSSQPWPFPGSIMLGFTAEARDETFRIDGDEIVEAHWFDRDTLRAPEAHGFDLPPRTSIARRMIDDWLGEG